MVETTRTFFMMLEFACWSLDLNVTIRTLEVADASTEEKAADDQAHRENKTKSCERDKEGRVFLLRHGRTTSMRKACVTVILASREIWNLPQNESAARKASPHLNSSLQS